MTLKSILKGWTPPILLAGLRRLRRIWAPRSELEIRYEVLDTVPPALFASPHHNAHGTHLNESGDTRPIEQYLRSFDLEQELTKPDVADNLAFLDQVISPLLPAQATVLDVGCGLGRYARFLRRPGAPTQGWRYAGVDRSEAILRHARQFCPGVEFASTEGSVTLPYPDGSHDLVMASSMLQYTGEVWRAALREMRRVAQRYIFISRLPVLRRAPSAYCRQTVTQGGQRQQHYFTLLNRAEFEAGAAELGCEVVAKDYGAEWIGVEGLGDPVMLHLYLLAVPPGGAS
jgi:SAM-dependent methyltransferase